MGVIISFDKTEPEVEEIVNRLKMGDPSIWIRRRMGSRILLNTLFLDEGDEAIIVERIKKSIKLISINTIED